VACGPPVSDCVDPQAARHSRVATATARVPAPRRDRGGVGGNLMDKLPGGGGFGHVVGSSGADVGGRYQRHRRYRNVIRGNFLPPFRP